VEILKHANMKKIELSPDQQKVLSLLKDDTIREVKYSGNSCYGKTWVGCVWVLTECLQKKKFFGITINKGDERQFLRTFNLVAQHYGFNENIKYNEINRTFDFNNTKSIVYLLNAEMQKADERYERWGAFELDGVFIDNLNDLHHNAYLMLRSRTNKLYITNIAKNRSIDTLNSLWIKK
jgi:hypothetical protein